MKYILKTNTSFRCRKCNGVVKRGELTINLRKCKQCCIASESQIILLTNLAKLLGKELPKGHLENLLHKQACDLIDKWKHEVGEKVQAGELTIMHFSYGQEGKLSWLKGTNIVPPTVKGLLCSNRWIRVDRRKINVVFGEIAKWYGD